MLHLLQQLRMELTLLISRHHMLKSPTSTSVQDECKSAYFHKAHVGDIQGTWGTFRFTHVTARPDTALQPDEEAARLGEDDNT
jgi:hypothetical protein